MDFKSLVVGQVVEFSKENWIVTDKTKSHFTLDRVRRESYTFGAQAVVSVSPVAESLDELAGL